MDEFGAAIFNTDLEAGRCGPFGGEKVGLRGDGEVVNARGVALEGASKIDDALAELRVLSGGAGFVGVAEEGIDGGLGTERR